MLCIYNEAVICMDLYDLRSLEPTVDHSTCMHSTASSVRACAVRDSDLADRLAGENDQRRRRRVASV